MTAVEKAQELVNRFMFAGIYFTDGIDGARKNAKQCALIAVDEIIDQWEYIYVHIADGMGELNPNLKYWYEVIDELNKSE